VVLPGEDWHLISVLFDEVIDLNPAQRQQRLARLETENPQHHRRLCQLLAAHDKAEEHAFLLTTPKITLDEGTRNPLPVIYEEGMTIGPWNCARKSARAVWPASGSRFRKTANLNVKLP
jgi:hypothetical protein